MSLPAGDRLLVVAAHPDDETLAAGGLLRIASDNGWQVTVLLATDGEASHPGSPTHPPARLAAVRRREVTAAVRLLAPDAALVHLGLPDSDLASHQKELTEQVVRLVGTAGADTLIVTTWLADGHRDHAAAAHACAVAAWRTDATCWQAPIWAWTWATPTDLPWAAMVALPLDERSRHAKKTACGLHRSQVAPLSPAPGDETLLTPTFLSHFERPVEFFVPTAADPSSPFDDLHAGSDDPWSVRSSWYERRKRAITLAALPRERFGAALEVGCSIGRLTKDLATRCDSLLGLDESAVAVARARAALGGVPDVEVQRADVPEDWPRDDLDLIVLSEVGYFLSPGRLHRLADRCRTGLRTRGVVLACHWRHPITGWPLDGPDVHVLLHERLGLQRLSHLEDADFVLDVWVAP